MNHKYLSLIIVVCAIILAFVAYPTAWNKGADFFNSITHLQNTAFKIPHFFNVPPFRLGLDLLGGTHLVYKADLSQLGGQSPADAMAGVKDVIERRVNLYGVEEPLVEVQGNDQLIVELAGIKDVNQAISIIGQVPFLEFKEERTASESAEIIAAAQKNGGTSTEDPYYKSTGLTGKQLVKATVTFDQTTYKPQVNLVLNSDGAKLFDEITKRDIGKRVAIYLDGQPISEPVVESEIPNGNAVITGNFTTADANTLAGRMNAGALPVPIKLISQQTIGASLGSDSLNKSLKAGLFGLLLVALFMILYYRLPGAIAVLALLVYGVIVLAFYKFIPVTLTLAGIAGFILSLGMAVDANILIFARMREELKAGRTLSQSMNEGFRRAWLSIRDGHVTTLLGAIVLYFFTTSFVKGFALTLGIGVLVSLFSATVVTRSFLDYFSGPWFENRKKLF
jgi:protein-export membrane protein SecD